MTTATKRSDVAWLFIARHTQKGWRTSKQHVLFFLLRISTGATHRHRILQAVVGPAIGILDTNP